MSNMNAMGNIAHYHAPDVAPGYNVGDMPDGAGLSGLRDRVIGSTLGQRVVAAGVGLFGFGGAATGVASAANLPSTGGDNTPALTDTAAFPNGAVKLEVKNAYKKDVAKAGKTIVFGADVLMKAGVHMDDCHWTKGAFTNSVRLGDGKLYYYRDSERGYLCRSDKSPTGWVKVKGGETGRPCYNPAKDKPVPKKDVEVINVRTFNTSFTLNANAKAKASAKCEGASASGYASASVKQRFSLKSFVKAKGNSIVRESAKLYDRAFAKATARAHCDSKTVVTPLPPVKPPTPPNNPPQDCTTNPELCPPEKPKNRPPTGRLAPPLHQYVTINQEKPETQPICVEDISDPDGDIVKTTFNFTNDKGEKVGAFDNDKVYMPNGTPDTQCIVYTSSDQPGQVNITASLNDGNTPTVNLYDRIPVVADQF